MSSPWFSRTGAPKPARMKPVPSGALLRIIAASAMQISQLLQVLVAVADAVVRTATDRCAKRHHQLVRGRCVADLEMHCEIMGAATYVDHIQQQEQDRRVG